MPGSKIGLRHVRYIIAAADSGSFRGAAKEKERIQALTVGMVARDWRETRGADCDEGAHLFRKIDAHAVR